MLGESIMELLSFRPQVLKPEQLALITCALRNGNIGDSFFLKGSYISGSVEHATEIEDNVKAIKKISFATYCCHLSITYPLSFREDRQMALLFAQAVAGYSTHIFTKGGLEPQGCTAYFPRIQEFVQHKQTLPHNWSKQKWRI